MPECILAIDAGGTSLKYGLMAADGKPIPGSTAAQTAIERDGKSMVLAAFSETAEAAAAQAGRLGHTIASIGVCCPGPFDFAQGMSRMTHKWQDAYEQPVAPVLQGVLGPLPVAFLHDSSAYVLGEGLAGAGRDTPDMAGVMLGTGFGFGYMRGGRVQVRFDQSPREILWNSPFRDGIVEDYVSRRAIRARYARLSGREGADVREIADAARQGDTAATQTFAETGRLLGEILEPVLTRLSLPRLVIGGQIARSAALFLPHMNLSASVLVAEHIDDAALRGVALFCALSKNATVEEG